MDTSAILKTIGTENKLPTVELCTMYTSALYHHTPINTSKSVASVMLTLHHCFKRYEITQQSQLHYIEIHNY